MEKWNKIYSGKFGGTWEPNEGIVRFSARYLKRKVGIETYDIKKKVRRILDLGCGNGRHVIFFAKQGYDVYGLDISKKAIKIANSWLTKERLKADLMVFDSGKLPFKDGYFDVVVSCEAIDHVLFLKAKKIIKEIDRILAPGGIFFITLRSTESSECGQGKRVAKNTFTLPAGYEKGLIQHYFDFEEIKELLSGFKIFDIELYEQKFPNLYTTDKSFLESSKGIKKYIDQTKPIDLGLKDSRWYIGAEKK